MRTVAKLSFMNLDALRTWGIAVGGALMAIALAISLQPQSRAAAQPQPAYEVAQAEAAPVAFIVRFRGQGPIARAQAMAARGRVEQAQQQVETQLVRQTAFAGLCFDRFTVGGAEIVLRTCDAVDAGAHAQVQQTWLARLRAMRAVEYADANAAATQDRAPG
ncbi:MAG: hypothetical protein R3C25_11230 [Hyphomonadaceae bacterium]